MYIFEEEKNNFPLLYFNLQVTGLTPYTKYEFRLQVSNSAGQLETPVTASSVTLPAGM